MKRLITTLFTLLFTSLALADSSNSIPSAPDSDISIAYLGQIFGTVGNVLHGTSGDMLGQMFYKFNQGIFVVAGMFIVYTTTTMVLRSATEGSFMGADKKSGWFTMLRIPLGLALLMPIPATGYETYQSIVMEAVIQGVNLADSTWNWALNYLQAGGVVYMPPSAAATGAGYNGTNTPSGPNYGPQLSMTQNVLASMTCMEMSNVKNSLSPALNPQNDPSAYQQYSFQTDNINFFVMFPGIGNVPGNPVTSSSATCGSVTWNMSLPSAAPFCSPTNIDKNAPMECSLSEAAITQVVADLGDAAKTYACNQVVGGLSSSYCEGQALSTTLMGDTATAMVSAMMDYQNLLMPLGNLQGNAAIDGYKNFIVQAQSDGWIMAGRYYWDISLLNDQYATAVMGTLPTPSSAGVPNATTTANPDIGKAVTAITAAATTPPSGDLAEAVGVAFNAYYGTQAQNSGSGNSNNTSISGATAVLLATALSPMNAVTALFQNPGVNPVMFIHQLGMALLGMAGQIWLGMSVTIFILYLVGFICSSESPVGQALAGIVDWLKPILLMIVGLVFGMGVTLAYYVPLYPYIIFTFGTIGWFIAVIEAMVAAPLVCFGLTHPEGHDFLGRAEQALMLLLSVFLRPTLMIIGLIAAMILSYVALLLLNTGFGGIVSSLYGSGTDSGGVTDVWDAVNGASSAQAGQLDNGGASAAVSLVVVPSLLLIFTMLVYTIIQQCYSLVFVLPENVLTWIGGPKTDSHAAQYAQQIEGEVKSAGKQLGEGMGASMGSGAGAVKGGGDAANAAGSDISGNKAKAKKEQNDQQVKNVKEGTEAAGGGGKGAAPP